jgi:acetolactate decarboxylase
MKYLVHSIFVVLVFALAGGCGEQAAVTPEHGVAKPPISNPHIVGAMRNVMWKGERFARIDFDTLKTREHLFALGPLEDLTGEFIIIDGKPFVARVNADTVQVDSSFSIRAPFAGYAYIADWTALPLHDSVRNLAQIDQYFDQRVEQKSDPFFFRMLAEIDSATYHVMNLPKGSNPTNPDEVHALGRVYFQATHQPVEILGFYSQHHAGIFTHHDTHSHLHLLSADRKHVGHVDRLLLKPEGSQLFVPTETALKMRPE